MSKTAGVWGIDIGQCALKALRLELIDGKPTATAFDYIEHAKILSQPDADPDALTREALEKFLSRNPIGKDLVAIGIPGQSGLARFVKLPPVEEKKIPDIVKFEAKQQIPFPLDEVVWDYQKIGGGETVGGFAMETEIGLFAMKRDLISKTLGHYQGVKAEVHVVQMTPLALCNYATYEILGRGGPDGLADGAAAPENEDTPRGKKRCAVVLDIGTDSSNLIITDGGKIIWQRPVPLGGNSFTKALVKEMKLTFAKAEHLKRNAAKSPELAQILKALRPVLQDFVGEVQRSLGYFTNTHRDAHVAFLVGLGSAFKLPGLQKYLSEKLSLEVKKPAKMTRLTGDTVLNDPTFNENVLTFPVAYGLALQGLELARLRTNLLPSEIRIDRIIRAKKPWAALAASLLVGGLAAACVGPASEYAAVSDPKLKPFMDAAKAEAGNAKKQNDETAAKEKAVDGGVTQVKAIVAGNDERLNWVRLNEVIGAALPRHGFYFDKDAAGNPDTVALLQQLGSVTDAQAKAVAEQKLPPFEAAKSNLLLQEAVPPVNQPLYWNTVDGKRAYIAYAKRIAKGVPDTDIYRADLSEHLAQVNVEAVTARYTADPTGFLKAALAEANKHGISDVAVTSMMSDKERKVFKVGPDGRPGKYKLGDDGKPGTFKVGASGGPERFKPGADGKPGLFKAGPDGQLAEDPAGQHAPDPAGQYVPDPAGQYVPDPTGLPVELETLPPEKKFADEKWGMEPPLDPKTKTVAPVWVVEVRGYTYYSAGNPSVARKFLQDCFVRNLQRFDEFAALTDRGQEKVAKLLPGATDPIRARVSHAFLCIAPPKPSTVAGFEIILTSHIDRLMAAGAAAAAAAPGGDGGNGVPPAMPGMPLSGEGLPGAASAAGGKWRDLLGGAAAPAGGGFGEGSGPLGGGPTMPGMPGPGGSPGGTSPGAANSPLVVGGRKKPFEFVVYFLWQEPSSTDTPAAEAPK